MDLQIFGASRKNDGFGTAGRQMMNSISDVGHNVVQDSDVHLTFSHPHLFNSKGKYNIGYFPWESTEVLNDKWLGKMRQMDEIWVPSWWQQEIVDGWGFESWVYEHGINPLYRPQLRRVDGKVRFLFMGLEAVRKGGLEAIRAFNIAFKGIDDVELIIKTQGANMGSPFPKITIIDKNLPDEELLELFYSCHAFVSPTYGEGFGLPARDAAGTGMPVIATDGFLPYEEYLNENLLIDSRLIRSPWPDIHPGRMYEPSLDHLVDLYREVYKNYNYYSEWSYKEADTIHDYYDWNTLTNNVFLALEQRIV